MRVAQWILFAISLMLILVNLRMMSTPLENGDTSFGQLLEVGCNSFAPENKTVALARRFVGNKKETSVQVDTVASQPEPLSIDRTVALFYEMLKRRLLAKKNPESLTRKAEFVQKNVDQSDTRKAIIQEIATELAAFEQKKSEKNVELVQADSKIAVLENQSRNEKNDDDIQVVIVDDTKDALENKRDELEKVKSLVEDLRDENTRLQYQMARPVFAEATQASSWTMPGATPGMQPQNVWGQPQLPQQNMTVNNGAQMASMAMQLQSSAMAMQQQASALMMQAQQQLIPTVHQAMGQPMMYQPQMNMQPMMMQPQQNMYGQQVYPSEFQIPRSNTYGNSRQDKIGRLMAYLQELSRVGEHAVQRVLWLVDLEFDIIEHLLHSEGGSIVERAVQERNAALTQSIPAVVNAYNMILELATATDNSGDPALYNYVVRKGRNKQSNPITGNKTKKKFLLSMMNALQHYYDMVQNMQQAFETVKR